MVDTVKKRKIAFSGQVGFPTELYFDLIDILESRGYTVKKKEDWLEVNPHSDYYQDVVQKKQNIEQQIGRIMPNISQMRKDLEMLRHDKRKLDRIIEHRDEGDIDYLKSDFVDLVDRNTDMSLLNLANNGIFPSIVVDFYKVESREDIDELDVSKGEKEVLRKKWQLFQDWMDRFVGEIRKRDRMIEEEIESKKASIEYYKDMLKPYLKALHRVKITEPEEYEGLHDPRIVERYSTSVAGVELCAWKGISAEDVEKYMVEERFNFFSFLDIKINRRTVVQTGQEKERIEMEMEGQLRSKKEIEDKERELEEIERDIFKSIDRMRGEKFEEELEGEEEKSQTQKITGLLTKKIKHLFGYRSKYNLREGQKKVLKEIIEDDVDGIYSRIKESGDALKLRKGG